MFKERIKTHHSAMADSKQYVRGMCNLVEAMQNPEGAENNAVIYIHVPFCTKICTFCNMRRSLQRPASNYADTIVQEILEYAKLPYVQKTVFDAVYFGGGTPTTLETEDLRKILQALKKSFTFTEQAEFSIETTVTQLTKEKWEALIEEGVTRFSVGVQTFHDEGRKSMGRIGSGEKAYELLRKLKETGVTVSMDLIYNYPGQSIEDLYVDLDKIIELDLDGFSMYSLIDMKETTINQAQGMENDEEMFYAISDYMSKVGYHFLELTKMVKNDRYQYIMNRHRGADTLPLGAGAGGSLHGIAMMNPIKLEEYEESVVQFKERRGMAFDPEYKEITRFKGDIQTAFLPRNTKLYKDYAEYEVILDKLLKEEMVKKDEDVYRLTTKGIFWGNTISRTLSALL